MGTAFTYQGQLKQAGVPVNDTCVIEFRLFDASTTPPGNPVGDPVRFDGVGTNPPTVSVINGLFTVELNAGGEFGADAFIGDARWLEVMVCCDPDDCTNPANFTRLHPRQELTPTPYALALPGLRTQHNTTSPNVIGGFGGNTIAAGIVGATIAGGGLSGFRNEVTKAFGTVGGGQGNTASGVEATVGGGMRTPPAGLKPPSAVGIGTLPRAAVAPSAGELGTTPRLALAPSAGDSPTPLRVRLARSAEANKMPPWGSTPRSLAASSTVPGEPVASPPESRPGFAMPSMWGKIQRLAVRNAVTRERSSGVIPWGTL